VGVADTATSTVLVVVATVVEETVVEVELAAAFQSVGWGA